MNVNEQLEDPVAQFDIPLPDPIQITFFNQLIFEPLELPRFISCTETCKAPRQADRYSDNDSVEVTLPPQRDNDDHRWLASEISRTEPDWQLSSLAQVCGSSSSLCSPLQTQRHYRG